MSNHNTEQLCLPVEVEEVSSSPKSYHYEKISFTQYEMNQLYLPPSVEELIPANHVVRVVNDAINRIDDAIFLKQYTGGGRSSYHPKLMTKIIVYGYTQKIYSSRQIAKAVREQIPFMWLSAFQTPDFRTINRFRSERMKEIIDEVFGSVLQLLIEEGYVKLDHYFLDGTKIEANANRYSFVWKKATDKYQAKLQIKIRELLQEINEMENQEQDEYGSRDLEELGEESTVTAEKLENVVSRMEAKLTEEPKNKPLRKAVKKIRKDFLPRCAKYEEQQATFGDRNSYSKTDPDATFMRMKEDHMRNGQLKPGYNVQIGTENQFIVGYSLHQRPTDTRCLKPHLEKVAAILGRHPGTVIADAGYGGEENYEYLENEGIEAIVKYSTYHKEKSRRWKKDISKIDNWDYDEETDTWTCAAGERLTFDRESRQRTTSGYEIRLRHYKSKNCMDCPLKPQCTKAKGNREIRVSMQYQRFKQQTGEKLKSKEGYELAVRRMIEPESVFGQMKNNRGFRRFLLRGLPKVNLEVGWLSLAHNLLKKAAIDQNKQ